jgi:thiamine pyrophosphokinase
VLRERTVRSAAIIAGGRLRGASALTAQLRAADLLICADGGLRAARRLGIRPHIAIGDFDSASPALLSWAATSGARIIAHPVEKDKTDTELALDFAAAAGARAVDFVGALGGRLDHELANVALLLKARAAGIMLRIRDGRTIACLAGRRTALPARIGDIVSLLPVSRRVAGVTTSGLRYPLHRATLSRGSTLGVSNVVTGAHPVVRVEDGDLLIVVSARGEHI